MKIRKVDTLFKSLTGLQCRKAEQKSTVHNIPKEVDIAIIGGGAVGSSIAFWLNRKAGKGKLKIAVIEKDLSYHNSTTVLSVGGIRQQFSLPENILLSLHSAKILSDIKKYFGDTADVYYHPNGYLTLASKEGAAQLIKNVKIQKEFGAENIILKKEDLKERFPWLEVSGVELGCIGLKNEGMFDPWALLYLLKNSANEMGTEYIAGKFTEFSFFKKPDVSINGKKIKDYEGINGLLIEFPNGEREIINFNKCIIAAGSESGKIAKSAKIGIGKGLLKTALPVERRKRYVYYLHCGGQQFLCPDDKAPFVLDFSGVYFRLSGLPQSFLCGLSPSPDQEPSVDDLNVDYDFFYDSIWPPLANRVPAFNEIKIRNAWAGYYDFNTFDQNGIIGVHPYYDNLYIATGFSGHGIQQSPAVGRAVAELIIDGKYETIDLKRLNFNRLINNEPMIEDMIV